MKNIEQVLKLYIILVSVEQTDFSKICPKSRNPSQIQRINTKTPKIGKLSTLSFAENGSDKNKIAQFPQRAS